MSVLLKRPALQEEDRLQLVAVKSLNGECIPGGSHLVKGSSADDPGASEGHTTSTCFSPELGCYIALALLEGGRSRHGEKIYAANPVRSKHIPVEVSDHYMVDKEGKRMHG